MWINSLQNLRFEEWFEEIIRYAIGIVLIKHCWNNVLHIALHHVKENNVIIKLQVHYYFL